jgi:oligopeptide/dipeptide ABC transporter ATP-binding protein
LGVGFPRGDGVVWPVVDVSFAVHERERVGIVGESGSGKSLTALAAAGLLPPGAAVRADLARFEEVDLLRPIDRSTNRRMATALTLVFQDAASALNPAMRVGRQLAEIPLVHESTSRAEAWGRAESALAAVRIPHPGLRARLYPHQLSGGMRQRALIAMSLMGTPKLVIADEPTTALDVTVQRGILQLLHRLSTELGVAILFISHDIAAVSQLCERVIVMYAGLVVETLPADRLGEACHPYTRDLVAAVPTLDQSREQPLVGIPGQPPPPTTELNRCPYVDRCAHATALCAESRPGLLPIDSRHQLACWHPLTATKPGGATP